ncbi:MAG TPA: DUF4157 domain-containing protein, partial [Chitinophagaceae bacterium]|nr:DUF4157 domain-containing protein [Chitinophagaceae bacterium]
MVNRTFALNNDTKKEAAPLWFNNKVEGSVIENNLPRLSYGYNAISSTSPIIQPKLEINQPGDKYEQEADAMADKVMRMPGPETNTVSSLPNFIQRKCAHCQEEEEKKKIQRKETGGGKVGGGNDLLTYVNSLSNSGSPLSMAERNFFEPRFGHDFSKVRIHTDNAAANSAKSINASAYTYGNNIVINSRQYSSQTNAGKRLLGHELTHVVQQAGISTQTKKNFIQRYFE